MKTTQRTFFVGSEKITIIQRKLANSRGYHTFINGKKYFSNLWLDPEKAEDNAFTRWMNETH